MINEVLTNHQPKEWEESSDYSHNRYHLYELGRNDNEFSNIAAEFQSMRIERVRRLQNPYMYGRFLLRQEHLRVKGEPVYTVHMYHPISKLDVASVAEYNCDYRRYTGGTISSHYQQANKKAKFWSSPSQIPGPHSNMSIVVAKVIHGSYSVPSEVVKDWDTEYYPDYIVDLMG